MMENDASQNNDSFASDMVFTKNTTSRRRSRFQQRQKQRVRIEENKEADEKEIFISNDQFYDDTLRDPNEFGICIFILI